MAQKKTTVVDTSALDQPPSDNQVLLLTNLYNGSVGISDDSFADAIMLPKNGEIVVKPAWAKMKAVRKFVVKGYLKARWVSDTYEAKTLPDPNDAPTELQVDKPIEANFAMSIAHGEIPDATKLINTVVYQPETTEIDVPYMRQTFAKVLKLADWLETQIFDRSKIHAEIKSAIRRINDL